MPLEKIECRETRAPEEVAFERREIVRTKESMTPTNITYHAFDVRKPAAQDAPIPRTVRSWCAPDVSTTPGRLPSTVDRDTELGPGRHLNFMEIAARGYLFRQMDAALTGCRRSGLGSGTPTKRRGSRRCGAPHAPGSANALRELERLPVGRPICASWRWVPSPRVCTTSKNRQTVRPIALRWAQQAVRVMVALHPPRFSPTSPIPTQNPHTTLPDLP